MPSVCIHWDRSRRHERLEAQTRACRFTQSLQGQSRAAPRFFQIECPRGTAPRGHAFFARGRETGEHDNETPRFFRKIGI